MYKINVTDKDGNKTEEPIYTISDFPYSKYKYTEIIQKNTMKYGRQNYLNIAAAFDIETTTVDPLNGKKPMDEKGRRRTRIEGEIPFAFMYHWQFCLKESVIFGTKWEEFFEFLERLTEELELKKNILVVYVHNLGFEFQFMKDFLNLSNFFAKGKRKPLRFLHTTTSGGKIEFRCSYFLSNMSLAKFCENSKLCRFYKKTDSYNYRKIRTCDTPVTDEEAEYDYCDVRGLCECIESALLEDDITTIPLTSTGYVRRDCLNASKRKEGWREEVKRLFPDVEQYRLLRDAFRGGDCHANRKNTGKILTDVKSADRKSAYPAEILTEYCPVSPLKKMEIKNKAHFDSLCEGFCVIFRATFINVSVKDNIPFPYIPLSKCKKIHNYKNDNGRILKADFLQIALTELDYKIIRETYNFAELYINECYTAKRGDFPDFIREVTYSYFKLKSELDGIEEKKYEYMKSKNKLNSIFGMLVTRFDAEEWYYSGEWKKKEKNLEEIIHKKRESEKEFLLYQHGVYITAHARYKLFLCYKLFGSNSVYQDTDSQKYLLFKGASEKIKDFNKAYILRYGNVNPPIFCKNSRGETKTLGILEEDGYYREFKTWGAKKYIYKDIDGKITVTVSGMNKKKASAQIKDLSEFEIGRTYRDVGRTESVFNDRGIGEITVTDYLGNVSTFTTASNMAVLDTTYTLGITEEYKKILEVEKSY